MTGRFPTSAGESAAKGDWVLWARSCRYEIGPLAQLFGVTPQMLADFFLVVTGRTISHWISEVRIWEEARLVCSGGSNVGIARLLGFRTETELIFQFDRYFGSQPKEFALKHQRWTMHRHENLSAFYGADRLPGELLDPPWKTAWRMLGPRFPLVQNGKEQTVEPSRAWLADCLHEAVCRGVKSGPEILTQLLWADLVHRLMRSFPTTEETLVADAVTDGPMDYLHEPQRFNPSRGTLEGFLYQAAWRNLCNSVRSKRRFEDRTIDLLGKPIPIAPSPADLLMSTEDQTEQEQTRARRKQRLLEFCHRLSRQDQGVLGLTLRGERRCRVYPSSWTVPPLSYASKEVFQQTGIPCNGAGVGGDGQLAPMFLCFVKDPQFLELKIKWVGKYDTSELADPNHIRAKIGLELLEREYIEQTADGAGGCVLLGRSNRVIGKESR